ncbi:addiction module protein [Luteolibacter yonseiensis]|uniref:Addiction module protein n=1 Tax=Luteolibacter yonseiensis TaxID=1144680 RepID=A0A934R5X3_9BACT|nr:addiction module protein [Luteolibacter yonseiensis]
MIGADQRVSCPHDRRRREAFNEARALGEDERIALAEKLVESISLDAGILTAQLDEVESRAADLASGAAITIPGEAASRMVRAADKKGRVE